MIVNGSDDRYLCTPRFENKGAMMGCSNPHPHGQAWTLSYIPKEAQKILDSQLAYYKSNKSHLLLDYAKVEIESNSPRVVVKSEHFAAMVPYWAVWPFEVMICPVKRRISHLLDLDEEEKADLASVIRKMTCRYDNRKIRGWPS
jgi:UDPglucose--hexose-1-phosphate uridylyltransferase